ncbi:thioesterase II family protein, partial [Mycolicibacter arupensis]|uniref:thioesterase II family protein n=1 Tax=Mycolicibacter arupensis TaxID=342002 RepID=UPI003B3BA2EA
MTDRTPKLYIFPHAGGSPQYYVPFSKAFTTDVKRIGVQYPGKGGTHDLGAFTSIEDLADQVCKTVAPPSPGDGPVAFLGPSKGARLAVEGGPPLEADGPRLA